MEFSTHLNLNENLPLTIQERGTSKKRPPSEDFESSKELASLQLRKRLGSSGSLATSGFTDSRTDLPSISSIAEGDSPTETEVDQSLRAYLHPSPELALSPVLLHPSASVRSATTETERTEVDGDADTDRTETEEEQNASSISSPTASESIEESLPDWAFQEPEDITHLENSNDILASKGITRSPQFFGKGNFGRVYDATIQGDSKAYLYKHYLKPISFEKGEGKFWRQSDFAASRLHDIPHLVKPLFFIVLVKGADGSQKKIFLPASKVQEFGRSLPAGSKVFLQGQFMEKAPGKTLQALREEGLATFTPDWPHFRNIARGLHHFLTASRPHNFMHRDLNLNNIIYDKEVSKRVSIVDIGQGMRLRSRGKTEAMMKNKTAPNPATSKVFTGTPDFMAPAVVHQKNYGAEVDAGSVALLLLNLVDKEDFERFSSTRFIQKGPQENEWQDLHFGGKDPADFLKIYLEKLGPDSETAKILTAYPQVREIIDLAFRASAPGPAGEAAFAAFRDHPYFVS